MLADLQNWLQICNKVLVRDPPHLRRVAALPFETFGTFLSHSGEWPSSCATLYDCELETIATVQTCAEAVSPQRDFQTAYSIFVSPQYTAAQKTDHGPPPVENVSDVLRGSVMTDLRLAGSSVIAVLQA